MDEVKAEYVGRHRYTEGAGTMEQELTRIKIGMEVDRRQKNRDVGMDIINNRRASEE